MFGLRQTVAFNDNGGITRGPFVTVLVRACSRTSSTTWRIVLLCSPHLGNNIGGLERFFQIFLLSTRKFLLFLVGDLALLFNCAIGRLSLSESLGALCLFSPSIEVNETAFVGDLAVDLIFLGQHIGLGGENSCLRCPSLIVEGVNSLVCTEILDCSISFG